MLLSINEGKIAELLNASDKMYAVENVPIATENYSTSAYPATTEVSGVVYAPLLITEEDREQLMSLRRQIENSGIRLKSAEQLTKELDEMRGRR